jgi:hypothetical protein
MFGRTKGFGFWRCCVLLSGCGWLYKRRIKPAHKSKCHLNSGAVVTKEDADEIGAMFGKTREGAVALAKQAIENKKR